MCQTFLVVPFDCSLEIKDAMEKAEYGLSYSRLQEGKPKIDWKMKSMTFLPQDWNGNPLDWACAGCSVSYCPQRRCRLGGNPTKE